MIDDVVEGVFEVAGEDLTREGDGEQFELVVVVVFVSGHPVLRISGKGCWIIYSSANTLLLGVWRVFLQAQRRANRRRFSAVQRPKGAGLSAGLGVFILHPSEGKLLPADLGGIYFRPVTLALTQAA